jgi:hypothetical protein
MKRLPPPSQTPSIESENYFERFENLVEIYDEQLRYYDELMHARVTMGSGYASLLVSVLAPCAEEENVDTLERLWCGENIDEPSRNYLVKRLGLLVGSFPSVNPHSPKVYLNMLVARVMAKHPSCMVLESACNNLVDNYKYSNAPNIADLILLLAKHKELWEKRLEARREIDSGRAMERAKEVLAIIERDEQKRIDDIVARLTEVKQLEVAAQVREGGVRLIEQVMPQLCKWENEQRELARLTHQGSHNGSNGKSKQKNFFKEYTRPTVQPLWSYSDADNDDDDEGETID